MRTYGISLAILILASPAWTAEAAKDTGKTYQVPYRLTDTKHVLVRVKINGKGPFNFIIDTGAPALYVSTAVCKKIGVKPGDKGIGIFDRFELEGGVVIEKARGRIDDPFQLEGMNQLGMAGAELHGMIGFNILARYKIEFDFTRDKMAWTRLNFDPALPRYMEGKGSGALEPLGMILKLAAALLGKQADYTVQPRGFLGIGLAEKDGVVTIASVLPHGPAEKDGLQAGDRVEEVQGKRVKSVAEVGRLVGGIVEKEPVRFKVVRGGQSREVKIQAGKGF